MENSKGMLKVLLERKQAMQHYHFFYVSTDVK